MRSVRVVLEVHESIRVVLKDTGLSGWFFKDEGLSGWFFTLLYENGGEEHSNSFCFCSCIRLTDCWA